ncbi:hypothetical protein KY285_017872 [Solanum tuberosum]|nr:hypothetical protein KY284_017866 [Solanum tuberosum]KAH0690669.1 hypothetical protein KY289_018027 [Solanum tuberosum]KAH0703594.1 hypothetical protein KY285_017872 [Solanum tuberosum]
MFCYVPKIVNGSFVFTSSKEFCLCSWNATYDSLFGSNKLLPMSIPLAEMVDFLMDFWELEGLYD